jgi:hypothetical protein
MHNGDTIRKLIAAVDTIHERSSGNAFKTPFASRPQRENGDLGGTNHSEANLIRTSLGNG